MHLTGERRVLQLHPTRRCNLSCLHCYSMSGPAEREELSVGLVDRLITDAAALGYDVLAVSGGEPALYPALPGVLRRARAEGMGTTVVTNGALLAPARLESVVPHLDLLVVSLDGPPADHDRMRAREGAFDAFATRLDDLRATGVPFGFLFTLTQHNVHQLEWAAGFASENGAALLQVHPLDAVGAAVAMRGAVPDATECAFALLETLRLQRRHAGRMRVHLDLAPSSVVARRLETVAAETGQDGLPSPLVVEPDGWCVPFQYAFPRHLGLGRLLDAPLSELAAAWTGRDRLRGHLASVAAELDARPSTEVVDGYALVAAAARGHADAV